MQHDYNARHLNLDVFSRSHSRLEGAQNLATMDRLADEAQGSIDLAVVHYIATGSIRAEGSADEQVWLALSAEVALPLICQRCLGPVDVSVQFEREFRFVASEEMAEAQDEESEEDVLVLSRDFNLLELIEDELLMALPVVPKHSVCPGSVKLQVADADFEQGEAEKPNPFAVLERLKIKP